MQTELQAEYPQHGFNIIGINQPSNQGQGGEALVAAISTLPMVQDDATANVWPNWGAVWRDIKILDRQNEVFYTYNLTQNSLAPGNGLCSDMSYFDQPSCEGAGFVWTENYDHLKQKFIDAATQ